jgi:hypothetical protein
VCINSTRSPHGAERNAGFIREAAPGFRCAASGLQSTRVYKEIPAKDFAKVDIIHMMAGSLSKRDWRIGAAMILSLASSNLAAKADPVADFYTGKTIDLYIGFSPGGTYDLYSRLVAMFMGDHIPGRPKIIPRTTTGAGSRRAAEMVYAIVPKDGLSIGTADQALAIEQAMGDPDLRIDTAKLNWLGTPITVNNVTAAWAATGISTIDQLKQREATVGVTGGSASSQYPLAMNTILGTKFKIVYGYQGGPEINLAMEKGEVDIRGSNDWISWKVTKPDWIAQNKIIILVQIGLQKEPDLPNVPLLSELATNSDDISALRLLSSPIGIGRPLFTSPGVPPERLAALQRAFDETMVDPAFLAVAKQQMLPIRPTSGLQLQKEVEDILSTPKPVAERLHAIIGDAR